MDPATMIVSALAAGAVAGLKPTAEKAVKDLYEGLKKAIQERFTTIDVTRVEKAAAGHARDAAAGQVAAAGASRDAEVLSIATQLLEAVRTHDEEALRTVGVHLEDVNANNLRISGMSGFEQGLVVKRGSFAGDIDLSNLSGAPPKNP